MKFHVQMRLTPQAGNDFEKLPGGPGPTIGRLLERFHPETVHMGVSARTLFLICDLTEADVAELMIVASEIGGEYPTFTPVIAGASFGEVVGPAIVSANAIING